MIKGLATAFPCVLALAAPALALDVQERVLQVSFQHNGQSHVFEDTLVPLLPGNACYNWYIRLGETGTSLAVSERMTLPRAIDWGSLATDQTDDIDILEGGTEAVSKLSLSTDELGWMSHGWCAAEGDPLGPHKIEVAVDGEALATFLFDVVDPATYSFPVAPGAPWAMRSANQVW